MQSMYCRFFDLQLDISYILLCKSDDKRRKEFRNVIQQNIFNDLHCPVSVQFVSGFVFEQVFQRDFKITTTPDQKNKKDTIKVLDLKNV